MYEPACPKQVPYYTHFYSSGGVNLSTLLATPVRWQNKEVKWLGNSIISRKHSINIPIKVCVSLSVIVVLLQDH